MSEKILSQSSSQTLHILRALAAQSVLVGHGIAWFKIIRLDYIQNTSVVVFFILSGFVISFSVLSKGQSSFRAYFIDRFSRIYVGFVPALVFVLGADLLNRSIHAGKWNYGDSFDWKTFAGNLLMLQDFLQNMLGRVGIDVEFAGTIFAVSSFGSGRPFWTVAVEWWIYLFFGWLILKSHDRFSQRIIYALGLIALAVVPLFNWFGGRGGGLAIVWLAGCVVYALIAMHTRLRAFPFSSNALIAAIIGVMACAVLRLRETGQAYDFAYMMLLCVDFYLIISLGQLRGRSIFGQGAKKVISFISDYSYSLYLVHYTILDFVFNSMGPGKRGFLVGFVVSNVVAIALYIIFERHYRTLRGWLRARLAPFVVGDSPRTVS